MSGSDSHPNRSQPIGIGMATNASGHWWDKISSSAPTKLLSSSFSNHWSPSTSMVSETRRESFSSGQTAEEHRRKSLDEWNTFTVGQTPF